MPLFLLDDLLTNYFPFRHVRGDKTIVCKHWLRGLCKKGDGCEFLHEYDMSKMPECYFYSRFSKLIFFARVRGGTVLPNGVKVAVERSDQMLKEIKKIYKQFAFILNE